MLAIQKHIAEHGLDATIEKFKLTFKDYPHKVLLKYQQIESPMSAPEVQDARGLVLKKSDWSVMSLAFRKFFNAGEEKCRKLDWSSARIFEKMDGTLIHVYFDDVTGKVCFGTTGTAEGEGNVDNFHWSPDGATEKAEGTFADLFWKAFCDTSDAYHKENPRKILSLMDEKNVYTDGIPKYETYEQAFAWFSGYTLAFELCTPHNIVVTPHKDYRVYLLGIRDLKTMEELPFDRVARIAYEIGVYMPRTFEIQGIEDVREFVATQPFSMEGVVAVDSMFTREKIKNPGYIAVHYMREATAYWRIVDVVRSGEISEYLTYFPGRTDEVLSIQRKWDYIISKMREMEQIVQPYVDELRTHPLDSVESKNSRKIAAQFISRPDFLGRLAPFRSYFFALLGGTKPPVSGEETKVMSLKSYLMSFDGQDLYKILSRWPDDLTK